MNFLIQIPQLIYAGAEKVLVCFANDLVSRGHEVTILESYDRGYLKPQFDSRVKFDCICSKAYTQKYYASLAQIKAERKLFQKLMKCGKLAFSKVVGYRRFAEKLTAKRYRDQQYDVAINYLETESPRFLCHSVNAKKYLQWVHIDVANMENPETIDSVISDYLEMDAIICVAESAKASFVLRYPQLAEKTHVIYNFFDVERILSKSKEPFSYPNRKPEVPMLLSVGRMTPQKKYMRFLHVLDRLKDNGCRFQWYVLGDGGDRPQIEAEIRARHLDGCVFLEGLTDNPYKYMANCDLFVLPSGWEGFPTVTVEAKILNCAVLATDVSGIREQMEHGKTGWIVENSEDGIYEGLKYLLEHPETLKSIRNNDGMSRIWDNEYKINQLLELI